MSFDDVLEEEVDLVNADYVPEDQRSSAIEIVQEISADGIAPEISEDIVNSAPMEVGENI